MKCKCLILSLLLCLIQPGQAWGQKLSGSGELTIRVKSSEGPIEGATVVLSGGFAGQRLNVTNEQGVCEFRGLQAGAYSLQVVQRSFYPSDDGSEDQMDVEIRNGQSHALNFYLVKGGVLKGRVVSVDGTPIIGMPISALRIGGKSPSLPSTRESNGTAVSDDRGEFRIYGLRPGSYLLAVNAQRNTSSLKSVATLFYPGERQRANGTLFDLLPGQEVSVPDMILDLTRTNQNSLLGVVQEAHGKPLKGVSLSLLSVDGSQISDSNSSDGQGYFNFEGLPSGQYLLKASFDGHAYFKLQREISIKDLAINEVTLELKPYPLISGRAYLTNRTGIVPLASLKLQLEPARGVKDKLEIVTDKDGKFSRRSSNEGLFWWTVPELGPQYFVSRITADRKDITNRSIQIDQASDLRGISIEISTGAAEIRGVIRSGTCGTNLVYALALDSKTDEIQFGREANCLADSFRIQSLPPGRYYVVGISTADSMNGKNEQPRTKKQGIDDRHYDAIEKAVKTLRKRGNKPLTLERGQIHEKTQLVIVDSEAPIK